MACAKLGAIWVPIFSGFGADAVAARLADAERAGARSPPTGPSPQGQAGPDEGDRRRARCERRRRVEHVVVVALGSRGATSRGRAGATSVGRARLRRSPTGSRPRDARPRAPAVHRLHERHDRPAEGRRARPRRVPGQDRRGGRVPGRPAPRRRSCTGSPTSAGSWGRGRSSARLALGATVFLYDGAPDHPGPDRLWAHGRAPRHHAPRRVADADPRADPRTGEEPVARARPVVAADPRLDRRAVEPGALPLVLRARSAAARLPDHQPVRRHRGRRVLPLAACRSRR